MMMPMMMMLAEVTPEAEIVEKLAEACKAYQERKHPGQDMPDRIKAELGLYSMLMMLKLKPKEMSTTDMMKKYQEHDEWLKLKPKNQ